MCYYRTQVLIMISIKVTVFSTADVQIFMPYWYLKNKQKRFFLEQSMKKVAYHCVNLLAVCICGIL